MKIVTIIEGRFGLGYRQSPYLYNNVGFRAEITEGNSLCGVKAISNCDMFFELTYWCCPVCGARTDGTYVVEHLHGCNYCEERFKKLLSD